MLRAVLTSDGVDDPRARESLVQGAHGTLTVPVPPAALDGALRGARLGHSHLLGATPVSGGSINEAVRLRTTAGDFFLKWHPGIGSEIFRMEAEGLEALAASRTVTVPGVVARSSNGDDVPWILLEWVKEGMPSRSSWRGLGRSLAGLHRSWSDRRYGWASGNAIGTLDQPNGWFDDWCEFWAKRRVLPLAWALRAAGVITSGQLTVIENLADRMDTLLGAAARADGPSLLHGDLWSGNVLFAQTGDAILIDPAVYAGHREVDLAMCRLFGGFPATFYHAYAETWSLQLGHEQRLPAYQLYPLLVHARLFGGGYVPAALRAAGTALAAC